MIVQQGTPQYKYITSYSLLLQLYRLLSIPFLRETLNWDSLQTLLIFDKNFKLIKCINPVVCMFP